MGFWGTGNAWGGGAESAHPQQNVSKVYRWYEIDAGPLYGVHLLATNSLDGQNNYFWSNI